MRQYAILITILLTLVSCEKAEPVPFVAPVAPADFDNPIVQEILKNNDSPEATYNLEGEVLKRYLDEVEYDNDYSYTKIKDYTLGKDFNEQVTIRSAYVNVQGLQGADKVYLVSDGDIQTRSVYSTSSQAVYSLIPGRIYRYGVVHTDKETQTETLLKTGCIATEGRVRIIKTKEIHNLRDVGGWEGLDGKHIKYGLLYRGGEIIDANEDITKFEPYDRDVLLNQLKVDFELDFRNDGDAPVFESPIGLEFQRFPLSAYDSIVTKKDRQKIFKNAIDAFLNHLRDGKVTYCHCQGGADRTGTFIFYIEGLLGVSDSDLAKDYEITAFYYHKQRNDPERYLPMIKALQNKYGKDITIGEAIYKSAKDMGVTDQDIQDLRNLMLE